MTITPWSWSIDRDESVGSIYKIFDAIWKNSCPNTPVIYRHHRQKIMDIFHLPVYKNTPDDFIPEEVYHIFCDALEGRRPDISDSVRVIAMDMARRLDIRSTPFGIEALQRTGLDLNVLVFISIIQFITWDKEHSYLLFKFDCEDQNHFSLTIEPHDWFLRGSKYDFGKSWNFYPSIENEIVHLERRTITIPKQPHTIAAALEGKMISEVIGGYIYDGWNAKIINVENVEDINSSGFPISYVKLYMEDEKAPQNLADLI